MRKIKKLQILCMSLLLSLTMLLGIALPLKAAEPGQRVIDQEGLLTEDEITNLNDEISTLSNTYQCDIVILTVPSLDGKDIVAYADDYYDQNGYGIGDDKSGVLFLVTMSERNYYISTCGDAIQAFTDYGIERAGEEVATYLSDEDYAGGFEKFLSISDDYLQAYQDGEPYDTNHPYQESKNYFLRELIALVIAIAVSVCIMLMLKHQMNNARPQMYAGDYIKKDSFNLTTQRDMFLFSQVSKVKKEKNEGSGSSTHMSDSGTSHGGGGGSF